MTLEAGRTYRIDLEGSTTRAGTLFDPYLYGIYDAAGNPIDGTTDNDDGMGFNSRVFFTAPAPAAYYVSAGGNGQSQGTYRLWVREVSDDFTAGTDTTGTVEIGGSTRGEIEVPYDRDWFAVTLEAGRYYRFDVGGSRAGAGTLDNPYLHGVYDANGHSAFNNAVIYRELGSYQQIYFTAPETATYYVAAAPWRADIGTYTLSARDVTDDYAAGTDTTGRVAVDGSATGEIAVPGDRDWFAVTLKAGKTYRIDLKGASTGAGTLDDPRLMGVHDARGVLTSFHGSHGQMLFTPLGDATYYVVAGGASDYTSVGGFGQRSYSLGTYTLSVTDVTKSVADDFAAGTGTTGTVEVGGSATGEIGSSGDRDWFAVDLVAGKTYRIDMEGTATGAGSLNDPYLPGVYDADGNLIGVTTDNDNGAGRNSRVYFTAAADVTYYVSAAAFAYSSGTYTLSVTDVTDSITDDLAVATGTGDAVEVGGSATGEIETSGDRDRFAVTLEAGKIYRIDLEGSATAAGTLDDPYLFGVYQSWTNSIVSGTRLNDGGVGLNSRVYFTAPAHGLYYVTAGAAGDGVGGYTLSVTDVTDSFTDDFAAGTGTSGEVEVGGSATGEIGYGGDRDWFAMTLEAGRTYRIDMEGTATGAGSLDDPYLEGIHGANGVHLGGQFERTPISAFSRLRFTAPANATYYVSAGAYEAVTGTYTLSVTDVTDGVPDDFSAGTGTTGTVAVGGSATGKIDAWRDLDRFAVSLEAGKTYQIDLEGWDTRAGTLRQPALQGIHDAHGTLIAGTADYRHSGEGRNSRVIFNADADATYYVVASGQISHEMNHEGTYTLSVADVSDSISDDVLAWPGTTGTVSANGSVTGRVDYAGDRDWFAVTLEAGHTYQIDLEGSDTSAGTVWTMYLYGVHDADGNLIANTADIQSGEGNNSRLFFTASHDAIYYVGAGSLENELGTYTLSVADVSGTASRVDDFLAWTGTTGTVAVGGSANGKIDYPRDRDWFEVSLEGGRTYRIDLKGWDPRIGTISVTVEGDHQESEPEATLTGAGILPDPYLRGVHDADGNLIPGTTDNNDGEGLNSRLEFTAPAPGTYYVAAGAAESFEGTYALSVEEVTDGM